MPESIDFYNEYLGEYPWSSVFFSDHYDWIREQNIPAEILVTNHQYIKERGLLDCSSNDGFRVKLPAKLIIDEMELVHSHLDGRFFDKQGDLVACDPSVFGNSDLQAVIIRKDKLCAFLEIKEYSILWTLLGEKNIVGTYAAAPIGKLEINGAYTFNDERRLIGVKKSKFEKFE